MDAETGTLLNCCLRLVGPGHATAAADRGAPSPNGRRWPVRINWRCQPMKRSSITPWLSCWRA